MEQLSKTKGKGYVSIPSGNHDFKRMRSDERTLNDLKVIFTMLLSLPGIPFIYYGDEIGMRYIKNLPSKEGGYDRTGSRTPMQWNKSNSAGFSSAASDKFYLPVDPSKKRPSVETQDSNPSSLLNHVRKLIALRKNNPALQSDGSIIPIHSKSKQSPFVYLREYKKERFLVAINPSALEVEVNINKIKINDGMLEIGQGIKCIEIKNRTKLIMSGVSYAIFKL